MVLYGLNLDELLQPWRLVRLKVAVVMLLVVFPTSGAEAHHEAIFGPQSALLSADRVFSAQIFTRQTGPKGERVQETTTVFSAGFSPTRAPLSVSIVMPFSVLNAEGPAGTRTGIENAILAARYRFGLPDMSRALGADCYLLGLGGVELPIGTIDHDFGDGAPAVVAAGSFGLERRPFSVIAYGLMHRYGEHNDLRESGNRFFGAGFAWTPLDREQEGRLFSLQFGLSHETTTQEELNGMPVADSGGWALVVHPTVVWAASPRVLLFALTSLPVATEWNSPADDERFRLGAGATISFGRH